MSLGTCSTPPRPAIYGCRDSFWLSALRDFFPGWGPGRSMPARRADVRGVAPVATASASAAHSRSEKVSKSSRLSSIGSDYIATSQNCKGCSIPCPSPHTPSIPAVQQSASGLYQLCVTKTRPWRVLWITMRNCPRQHPDAARGGPRAVGGQHDRQSSTPDSPQHKTTLSLWVFLARARDRLKSTAIFTVPFLGNSRFWLPFATHS